MSRFNSFQRMYLYGSTALGFASLVACLVAAARQPTNGAQWLVALGLAVMYGLLWLQNEEFETRTTGSPILVEVSATPLLVALVLVGPLAVPLLLLAEAVARWWQRRGRQPLGYLFNFNQRAANAVVTLAVLSVVIDADLRTLGTFPVGTSQFILILAAFELFARVNHALLVAVGSRQSVSTLR